MARRSNVYVDGFNLYYGAVKDAPFKWLDLHRFFTRLRQDDDIRTIFYFTALIDGPRRTNQDTYLRALATLPSVRIILGRFKKKQVTCRVAGCTYPGSRVFAATEEKRTDVNIATLMISDAYQDAADRFVIVSGDSDLVPAIREVKTRFPAKEVIVYVPARDPVRGHAVELRRAADKHHDLPLALLPHCQFPTHLPDGRGGAIVRPIDWPWPPPAHRGPTSPSP